MGNFPSKGKTEKAQKVNIKSSRDRFRETKNNSFF